MSSIDVGSAPEFAASLTRLPHKAELFGRDAGFRWAAACLADAGLTSLPHDYTAMLLRPEVAFTRTRAVVHGWLSRNGFELVSATPLSPAAALIRELWRYQWDGARLERIALTEGLLMLGGNEYWVLRDRAPLTGVPASVRLGRRKGSRHPSRQRSGELRSELATPNALLTYIHVPDEPADFLRELGVVFEDDLPRVLAGLVTVVAVPASPHEDRVPCDPAASLAALDEEFPASPALRWLTSPAEERARPAWLAAARRGFDGRSDRERWLAVQAASHGMVGDLPDRVSTISETGWDGWPG